MKQSIIINAPISQVFENITKASNREKWILNVTSITYHNPTAESQPGAKFQLSAEEGKEKTILSGSNKDIIYPTLFSFNLQSDTYIMSFSYQLQEKGSQTLVEQSLETTYHKPLMNFIEKLFKGTTKQTGDLLLTKLKAFSESG